MRRAGEGAAVTSAPTWHRLRIDTVGSGGAAARAGRFALFYSENFHSTKYLSSIITEQQKLEIIMLLQSTQINASIKCKIVGSH